jgi:hypothetical protein
MSGATFPNQISGVVVEYATNPQSKLPDGRRASGQETATMPRGYNGEKRPIGLDQVRAKVHTGLRYDDGKFAGLGQEGDRRRLQKNLLGRCGKCMVAWKSRCRPTNLGGLGISDLQLAGYALQTRWLWLQQADEQRAWSQLPISVCPQV